MNKNSEIGITVEAWAEITIKEWIKKIEALGIHNPGQLVNSLYHHVNTSANGNPEYVKFVFEYYGKFVDMGVGKGVKLEDRVKLMNADIKRNPKPWYSSVFLLQVKILTRIMAEKFAKQAADMVVTELDWSNKKYVPKKRATIGSSKKRSKSMSAKQYDKLHGN